jgi:hypothetical protein
VLSCVVDHILQEFNTLFLTRFRTYKIATPFQTKMTRKDDIYGLVSYVLGRNDFDAGNIYYRNPAPSNGPPPPSPPLR